MPRRYSRNLRVADLLQRELAVLIQREMGDKNVGLITVCKADVSPDLKNAKIYVTGLGGDYGMDEVVKILNDTSWFFRRELAKTLILRNVPKLKFIFDNSIERGSQLTALIDSLVAGTAEKPVKN